MLVQAVLDVGGEYVRFLLEALHVVILGVLLDELVQFLDSMRIRKPNFPTRGV